MVDVPVGVLVDVVNELSRAGRWAVADRLTAAAGPHDDDEEAELALARANTEVDRAFWSGSDADRSLLQLAHDLARDEEQRWAAKFARLRGDFAASLRTLADGQDATRTAQLASSADELITHARSDAARAYVRFYRGLIADVLAGDPGTGGAHYRAALDTDDDYVRSYALRHLGALASDLGDDQQAIQLWQESTRLRQRTGFLPGVLAQLMLLGDESTLPDVVSQWAEQAGLRVLQADSTAEPTRD